MNDVKPRSTPVIPIRAARDDALVIDSALLRRHGGAGPRYTSYPTADRFVEAFDARRTAHWLAQPQHRRRSSGRFGLYVHVPFCDTLCYYCACNKIVTQRPWRARLKYVTLPRARDGRCVADALGTDRRVVQMHWGGGTPTFLGEAESARADGGAAPRLRLRARTASTRSRSIRARSAAAPHRAPGRPRLQPHQHRRAGLRPRGAAARCTACRALRRRAA